MVIVLLAHAAVTPVGSPMAVPIPVAPVVECVISVNDVLIHNVDVDEGEPTVLSTPALMICGPSVSVQVMLFTSLTYIVKVPSARPVKIPVVLLKSVLFVEYLMSAVPFVHELQVATTVRTPSLALGHVSWVGVTDAMLILQQLTLASTSCTVVFATHRLLDISLTSTRYVP